MRGSVAVPVVATVLLCPAGCGGDGPSAPPGRGAARITVTSPAFEDGGAIPARFTCDGAGVSPPLAWSGVPDDASALALVVDDPDAPGGSYTHWVVVDLPADTASLDTGARPPGTRIENSAGDASYAVPCPPSGTHHYRFTLYALDHRTGLDGDASLDEAYDAIESRTIGWGRLVATYSR